MPRLLPSERERIITWLSQARRRQVPDNNWHLVPVQVSAVLQALGEQDMDGASRAHYERFKSFYVGDGW